MFDISHQFASDEGYSSERDPRENVTSTRYSVELAAEAALPTEFGDFRISGFRSLTSDEEFVAVSMGRLEPEAPTLARVHSQCLAGDVFGSTKCDCGQQLREAMK